MSAHTPTPWEVHEDYPSYSLAIHGEWDDNGSVRIAEIVSDESGDAAYIVLAVNSHQELVDAAREMVKVFDSPKVLPVGYAGSAVERLRQAIAKAEGK